MSEDISKFLLSQSIARTCLALGYQETSNAVIQSLTDIIQHYIEFIGERSVEQAEQSGRCHPGIQDILQALGSIEFKTLREFKWNQPFHYEVPSFPINKSSKRRRHDLDGESTIRGSNVPSYLPAFPPRHTYSRKVKKVKALEQREVQVKAVSATRSIQATLSKIESADV